MGFAANVPSVPAQRRMNLGTVVAARQRSPKRPSWSAIFAKAYAMVAQEYPELRRIYFGFPRQRLFEYPHSIASIAIEITFNGEHAVLPCVIEDPASLPLVAISEKINKAVQFPDQIAYYRRFVNVAHLPSLIRRIALSILFNMPVYRATRFGTFALSAVASLGTDLLHPLTAWPTLLTYGVLSADGSTDVRIIFDHRVMDGGTIARVLARLEEILNGPIVEELQGAA
jgi:hypothetical protein